MFLVDPKVSRVVVRGVKAIFLGFKEGGGYHRILWETLNFVKMADILKILKTQNCSSNGDLSLCQHLCLYHYSVRSYQH
jgi:hypothetical protein